MNARIPQVILPENDAAWLYLVPDGLRQHFARNPEPASCGGHCYEWQRGRDKKGYGHAYVPGADGRIARSRPQGVHRVVWQSIYGEIEDGLFVLHHCDNPPCGAPYHLFLGTNQDNVDDMMAKGRHVAVHLLGESSATPKLDSRQVMSIYQRLLAGESRGSIAKSFGMSKHAIYAIATGKTWAHLPRPSIDAIRAARPRYVGERVARKLTDDSARKIHQLHAKGLPQKKIAEVVGVDSSNVCRVLKGELWPHIKEAWEAAQPGIRPTTDEET